MSSERVKRTVKPPKKFEEELDDDKPLRPMKHIFRLLTKSDLTKDILEKELFILWPDNGQWYAAEIIKLDLRSYMGTIEYTETEEEEKNVKVLDLVKNGEIAFKESRPVSHKLKKGELNAPDPSPEPKHKQGDDEDSDGQDDGEQSNASEENSGAEQADDHIDLNPGSMKGKAKHQITGSDAHHVKEAGSAAKRARPSAADGQPSTPTKGSRTEPQPASKRQVLPTEKALQLLREGQAGSRDFSAADAASRKLMDSLLKKRASGPTKPTTGQAFYGGEKKAQVKPVTQSLQVKSRGAASSSQRNATLQARYVQFFKDSLDKAVKEAKAANREGANTDTQALAKRIEDVDKAVKEAKAANREGANTDTQALAKRIEDVMFKHFGGYNDSFRARFRNVHFNLKDDKNQDFRGKVLRGEVQPIKLLRMNVTDMASEEQQEWRRKREEESLKNSVLDSAAAARFSTAAALEAAKEKGIAGTIDWRTSTLVGDEGPAEKKESQDEKKEAPEEEAWPQPSEQAPKPASAAGTNGAAGTPPVGDAVKEKSDAKPETPRALERRVSSGGTTSLAAASSFDWAKIKEKAREEAANAPVKPKFETFEDFAGDDAGEELADVTEEEPEQAPHSAEAARWQAVPDLAPIIASSSGRNPDVWSGRLTGIAPHGLSIIADYLAGPADIAALLSQQQVHVKGRLPFDKVERFCEELRRSRRRTCSIAIVRSKHGPSQEFTDAVAEYSSRGRAGISDLAGGVEGYLVPPSDLAERLIKTSYLAEGRELRREADGLPEELETDQMLLLLVHLKDWGQHIMHTEQALQKASPLHATSPEHVPADKASISPAHVPDAMPQGAGISPHHASANLEDSKPAVGTPQHLGPHASPAPAEAAADTQLHAPSQAPQAAAADPRQRSADSRQRAADPRLVAAQAQAPAVSASQPSLVMPAPAPTPAAAPGLDFGALGALAQALGVGLSMPAPAAPQQGQDAQGAGFSSTQSFPSPQYQQQQQGMEQPQYQQVQQQMPPWGQANQQGGQGSQQQPQQQQQWPHQTSRAGGQGMQQQPQGQQLPGPPSMQQQQPWQPQQLQGQAPGMPPILAPPQQGTQSPMHDQQQQMYGQQQQQQMPTLAAGFQGGLPQHSGQQRPPIQLPPPQPLPAPAGQPAAVPRPITLAPPGQPRQQHAPRPQQPITLPPPGQQHAQRPPGPITLQPPMQRGPPPVQHPQQSRPQAPITLRPPGPITLKAPVNPRQQKSKPERGGQGGRAGGRGRADGQIKRAGGRSEDPDGPPTSKRPRVMGPGAKGVVGFQG